MKQLLLVTIAAIIVAGCHSSEGPTTDDKKLRDDFSQKEFDINKVPEKDRARVEGIMRANGQAPKKN